MNKSYLKYVAKVEENMKKAQERLATTTADYEQGPCQDGYVQIGVKEKDGRTVPNCVPESE
jgi:hypothetical protein